jgi:hypothetical protein
VNEKQMQDLPLNGRNALQLTTLTPGTVLTNVGTESGQQDNTGPSVNGLRKTQNNFQLDGTTYTNRFFDSVPTMPDPDALQEFTIQSSDYSAEYGGAGALVQLSTRSGSNEIHGTAFEFLRNTDLDARNFFNITRPPFKLNQFGGTAGGPIRKNKTFFFFSAQDTERRSAPSPISITTPSAAERSGNFSSIKTSIVNPTTGQPFPGNIIPATMFNPAVFRPGATVANENSRRLYPGLAAVELASSYVYEEFNSLQINATKRFSKGVTLLSNFTWGKTIDDTSSATEGNTGPPNPFNFNSARGPADFDQEFRFNLSLVYALPHVNVTGLRAYS